MPAKRRHKKYAGVRPRGKSSYEINYYVNGRRCAETVKASTEGEAYTIRLQRLAISHAATKGEKIVVEAGFEPAMEHYATVNEKILQPKTLQRSRCIYGHFIDFIRANFPHARLVSQLINEHALKYKDALLGLPGKTASGINTDISKLRAIFKKFKEYRFVSENIFAAVSKIPSRQAKPEKKHLPTDHEIRVILGAVKGDPSYEELTKFLVRVGRRIEEATLYEKKDVLLDDKKVPIKIVVRPEITKTKETGEISVDEELAGIIQGALSKHPAEKYLFANFAARKIAQNTYRDYLKRICQRHGLSDITPHCFRYYVVNKLLNSGVNIKDAMTVTGHLDIESFMAYVKTTEQGRRMALSVTRLSNI